MLRTSSSLLDAILPEYQFVSRHQRRIGAPLERVWTCVLTSDFSAVPIIRVLVRMRGIHVEGRSPHSLMRGVRAHGFMELAARQYQEIVIGGIAKPWQSGAGIISGLDADGFAAFSTPGYVRIALNLALAPAGEHTLLSTETRVQALDAFAHRRFRIYWTLIRLPSAAIRNAMLRDVAKRACEGHAHAKP